MDQFIEVIGTGNAKEHVAEYRAELDISVRAAQGETANAQAIELRDRCIRQLKNSGIREDELSEGGVENRRPWFWKQKVGEETSYRILLSCKDFERMMAALRDLEPEFANKRFQLTVHMRSPRFELVQSAVDDALAEAVSNARSKAQVLAQASGVELGPVIQVEELGRRTAGSGVRGDEDWHHYPVAMAGAASAHEDAPEHLAEASRPVSWRYRVRFGVRGSE
jgi:uncharacterized protein YggE